MKTLIALRPLNFGCGTVRVHQPFLAEDDHAKRLVEKGDAELAEQFQQRPGDGYWFVQPEWKGKTLGIIGGGPSVTPEQVEQLQDADGVIAINNAVQLAEWADFLYVCDERWYTWHELEVLAFPGVCVTLENLALKKKLDVRCLRDYGVNGFAPRNDGVTNGRNGGYQALHLAAWLGAARVLLIGYDMRADNGRMHWHEEHPTPTPRNIFPGWLECFATLAPELAKRNVEVINCTPGSALTVFPRMSLAAALNREQYAPKPRGGVLRDVGPVIFGEGAAPMGPDSSQDAPPDIAQSTEPEPAPEAGFLLPEETGAPCNPE